jgi:hypothetical protein
MSGTSSSIRTKLWWNSHLMVLFQNCVWQSRSPTKMAATGQLRCYWKQFWSRWAITGSWEPLVLYCIVLKVWFWLCDLQDSSFTIKGQRILWLVYYLLFDKNYKKNVSLDFTLPNVSCLSQAVIWVYIVLLCCCLSVIKQNRLGSLCLPFVVVTICVFS